MDNRDNTMQTSLPHGGDWAGFRQEYGRMPLDFSMNVNPLGISPAAVRAIAEAAQQADRYPDPLCRQLTQRLTQRERVSPEQIFCGSGAADIIYRLAHALKPAEDRRPVLLVTAPSFSEYETAFAAFGWEIRQYPLRPDEGFRIREDMLAWVDGKTDALFLCEPNNPTGVTTPPLLLAKILGRCRQTGTSLVVDECFNGFLENPAAHSLSRALQGSSGEVTTSGQDAGSLIILKAFTKLYGMAGVRLGYCLCENPALVDRIRRAGPPWNVSSLAQAAGIAALEEEGHVEAGLAILREEVPWLREQLASLGLGPVYGEANYLLFRAAEGLDRNLRRRGILIRDCSNYQGLGPGWYRVAVRTHEENLILMKAMKEACER